MLPLINRSNQSYGRSLMSVDEIVEHAKKQRAPVAALTDVHSLSALPDFLLGCHKNGIHGIAGLTVQITEDDKPVGEMVLLAKGGKGFAALRDLVDRVGHVGLEQQFNPSRGLPLSDLLTGRVKSQLENCLILDGFPGSIGEALIKRSSQASDPSSVKAIMSNPNEPLVRLMSQFQEGDYVAVQTPLGKSPLAGFLSMPSATDTDESVRRGVLETSIAYAKDDAQSRQAMRWFKEYASEYLKTLGDEKTINQLLKAKYLNATLESMPEGYRPSNPPFQDARYLIERCATPKIFKEQPESLRLEGGEDVDSLQSIVDRKWQAFASGLSDADKKTYRARLDEELDVIRHCRFEDYFINIYKVQMLAKSSGNELMLRGSAVSSLVMHVMGLSPIDPIKEDLLFARFMNRDRIEDPDVDIEFVNPPGIARDIENTFKSGQIALLSSDDGVAQAKKLLKMARDTLVDFYDFNDEQKNKVDAAYEWLTKPLHDPANKKKKWAGSLNDWIAEKWDTLPENQKPPSLKALVGIAKNMSQSSFGNSLSPGSVVFIPEGVGRYFNLLEAHRDKKSGGEVKRIPQTKYNLQSTGHIKYDLLANRSFTRAMNAWQSLELPPEAKLNVNDPTIGFVFRSQAFLGVNQVSGWVGAKLAERFQPKNFNELTAVNALIRDGGKESTQGIIEQYLYLKDNPEKVQLDPQVEPILKETHGCLLYEEQLMRLLTDVGGFDWNAADRFRSALKKGKGHVIDDYEAPFIQQSMARHGVDKETASRWYQPLRDKRGRFVFNKAHAVAYAYVAVRQCWLKTNYPAQYAAELFVDEKVSFRGERVKLPMILDDWRRLHRGERQPQNAQDFIRAVGGILLREEKNPDSLYRRNPGTLQVEIENAIEQGAFDFALKGGEQQRQQLLNFARSVFKRLDERGYEPVKHGRKKSSQGDKRGGGTSPKSPSESTSREIVTGKSEVKPANRRSGFIDWENGVMIGHLLDFLNKEKVIQGLEVSTSKSSYSDHYRFQVKDQQGKLHEYHVGAPSTDPIRARHRNQNHSPASGFHQGGARDRTGTNTLTLAAEIVSLTGVGGISPVQMKRKFITREEAKGFKGAFSKWVRQSKTPLHDAESGGILDQTHEPAEPTSPVMTELFSGQRERGHKKMVELFEETRAISVQGLRAQIDNGHLVAAEVRTDKLMSGQRKKFLEVVANYRKVSDTTPLYQVPMIESNKLSPGGHQRFMYDRKKRRASKMDLGFTTRRIRGHVHGHITPGADTLWLGEAAMDVWSFNELQRDIQQYNQNKGTSIFAAEENCVAIRSAGGATDTLEALLSIQIKKDKKTGDVDFRQVRKTPEIDPFSNHDVSGMQTWFKERTIHFLADGTPENEEARQKLKAVMQGVGLSDEEMQQCVKVHRADPKKNFNQNVNEVYNKHMNQEGQSFLHQSNMDTWLRGSDLLVMRNDNGEMQAGFVSEKVESGRFFSEMSPDEQQKLKQHLHSKFCYLTGAKSLGLALDNDGAGREDATKVYLACEQIGIPTGSLMPKERKAVPFTIGDKTFHRDLKDHNDYLMVRRELQSAGQYEMADQVLEEYAHHIKPPRLNYASPQVDSRPKIKA